MKTKRITDEERAKAFKSSVKPEVLEKQKLNVRYNIEEFNADDRPRRFLEAFAAILKHSNYKDVRAAPLHVKYIKLQEIPKIYLVTVPSFY